jgi:aryl carrier-like protein
LLMIEHHYIHDGWSFRKLLSEAAEIYSAHAERRSHDLQPPTQFRQYAIWQRAWLDSGAARRQTQAWLDYLHGCAPVLTLPIALPRPADPHLIGAQVRTRLPEALITRLGSLGAGLRLTLFQLMYGAFALLLRRYSGRTDFLLGTSSANRSRVEWESVLGMLVNMVAVRISFDEHGTAADWLTQCTASLKRALELSELPFSSVVDALKPPRTPGVMPLLQFQFSSHNALTKELRFANLDWEVFEGLANGTAKFDLGVISIPQPAGQGVELLFEFNTDLLDAAKVEQVARDYQELLEAIVDEPRARLDKLLVSAQVSSGNSAIAAGTAGAHRAGTKPNATDRDAMRLKDIESRLTAIWRDVLKQKEIGRDDNFFDLGGHSMLAMRMVARIRRDFERDLTVMAIFEAPTIAELAQRLSNRRPAGAV